MANEDIDLTRQVQNRNKTPILAMGVFRLPLYGII